MVDVSDLAIFRACLEEPPMTFASLSFFPSPLLHEGNVKGREESRKSCPGTVQDRALWKPVFTEVSGNINFYGDKPWRLESVIVHSSWSTLTLSFRCVRAPEILGRLTKAALKFEGRRLHP